MHSPFCASNNIAKNFLDSGGGCGTLLKLEGIWGSFGVLLLIQSPHILRVHIKKESGRFIKVTQKNYSAFISSLNEAAVAPAKPIPKHA